MLSGLSRLPRALSFAFTTIQLAVARDCHTRLAALGYRAFSACPGEAVEFAHTAPVVAAAIGAWIAALPHAAASRGDDHASPDPPPLRRACSGTLPTARR